MAVKLNVRLMCLKSALKGWNLSTLSQVSGVSRTTVSAIRAGKTCSVSTAKKIAKVLNLELRELIEMED